MLGLLLQSSRNLGDMIVDEAVVLELGGCGLSSWKGKERKGRRLMRRLEARVAALAGKPPRGSTVGKLNHSSQKGQACATVCAGQEPLRVWQ